MQTAKEIAKSVLKLGDHVVLEWATVNQRAKVLVDSVLLENNLTSSELLEVPILVLKSNSLSLVKIARQVLEEQDRKISGRNTKITPKAKKL